MIGFVVSITLSFLYTCCVWCYWGDLKTAIDVVDASSDFLADTYRIVLTPVIHFIVQFIVVFVWLGAMVCVISMNEITANELIP